MRKLTIIEHISLDGVIQAPGGPDEDRDNGFEHGGWSVPFHDPAAGAAIVKAHGEGFDLVIGRRVYDSWAAYWPAESNPMADSINSATKYVATHRPESLTWAPAESLGDDVVAGIRRVKSQAGPHLITWGSSTLTPLMLEHGLADEVLLLVFPMLLGQGKTFFSKDHAPRELTLLSSTTTDSGVLINTYQPGGPIRTGSFA